MTVLKFGKRNTQLSNLFTAANAKRISTEITDAALANPKYQAALLSVLVTDDRAEGFGRFIDYMPDENKELLRTRYEKLIEDTKSRISKSSSANVHSIIEGSNFKGKTVNDFFHFDLSKKQVEKIAALRLILEDKLKMDLSHWPLTVDPESYRFMDGIQGTFDPVLRNYRDFLETQSQWQSFFQDIERGVLTETQIRRKLKDSFSPGFCATQLKKLLK
jgi:hypothetical protein